MVFCKFFCVKGAMARYRRHNYARLRVTTSGQWCFPEPVTSTHTVPYATQPCGRANELIPREIYGMVFFPENTLGSKLALFKVVLYSVTVRRTVLLFYSHTNNASFGKPTRESMGVPATFDWLGDLHSPHGQRRVPLSYSGPSVTFGMVDTSRSQGQVVNHWEQSRDDHV